ncbi:MAG: hypothetical protein O2931_08015 [Planctomycetota bacterium]|nr:hypothetical protein [Planctomycetota bacterium]MDA1178726.1 hypothetical protein [Planctomycetota bacterium]
MATGTLGSRTILYLALAILFLAAPRSGRGQSALKPAPAPRPSVDEQDAAKLALLTVDRQNPEKLLGAVEALLRLGYAEDAVKLMATETWSPEQQESVVRAWGTLRLLQLGRSPGLDEASRNRVVRWLEVARRESFSAENIRERLIAWRASAGQLRSKSEDKLRTAGVDVLPIALEMAQDLSHEHRRSLARMLGPAAILPLMIVMDESDGAVREMAAELLTEIDDKILSGDSLDLWRNRRQTAWRRAAEYERTAAEHPALEAKIWRWNGSRLVTQVVRPEVEQSWQAWMWSRTLVKSGQATNEDHACDLLINLYLDKQLAGWRQPLPDGPRSALAMVRHQGVDGAAAALACGWKEAPELALVAAIEAFGRLEAADARDAHRTDPLLWKSLAHSNRRVRFAALESLLRITPLEQHAGASRLIDQLGWFAATRGRPRVLIIDGPSAAGFDLASGLRSAGLDADSVGSSFAALRNLHTADLEPAADYIAVLAWRPLDTGTLEFTQQLAQNPRTRQLPVWWIQPTDSPSPSQTEFEIRRGVESLGFFSTDLPAVRRIAAYLTERQGPYAITAEERVMNATRSLKWLEQGALGGSTAIFSAVRQRPAIAAGLHGPGDLQVAVQSLIAVVESASHGAN